VIVNGVEQASPAERAGVQAGDVLVDFAARAVHGIDELHRLLTDAPVGTAAALGVVRRGERHALVIVPAEAPLPSFN
jgi:serine protease Do